MKKILTAIILLLITSPNNILALERQTVTLNKCVDGDTAWFNLDDEVIKTRFLAIDTPESTNQIEEYGKEASNYTCDLLTNAEVIEIEYDSNSDKQDRYDRHLVWVFVDNELLQEKVVENGYAEVKYIYGNYKYLDDVNNALEVAKKNKVNLWSNNEDDISYYDYIVVIIGAIIIILVFIFNEKSRNKIVNKGKKQLKKSIKKLIQ